MSPRVPHPGTAARMRATAAPLATTGLDATVHSTRGVLDIAAALAAITAATLGEPARVAGGADR